MRLMARLFFWLFTLPLFVGAVAFAVANRTLVELAWNPLETPPTPLVSAPVYVVVFASFALGAVLGGFLVWNKQRAWRRLARQNEAKADKLTYEINRLHAQLPASQNEAEGASPVPYGTQA